MTGTGAALRDDVAIVDAPGRDVVTVVGPDARSFLQAIISADLDALAPGQGARSLLLAPQGKLDVAFRVLVVSPEELWLDCDAGFGAQLAAGLGRYRIRVDAEITPRPDLAVVSAIGPRTDEVVAALGVVPATEHAHVALGDLRAVRTTWGAEPGIDLLGAADAIDRAVVTLRAAGVESVDAATFEGFRIARGVPRQPDDVGPETIPQEAELEVDGVSFTKGCFIGQELVCRIDSRGHVNRFLRRLVASAGATISVGDELVAGDKVVGAVTSVAPVGSVVDDVVALGYVRREIDLGTEVTVVSAAATGVVSVRVEALHA